MRLGEIIPIVVAVFVIARCAAEVWLEWLNRRHVLRHSSGVPNAFQGVIDEATYARSIQYTLAKSRLSQVEITYSSAILMAILLSGFLPWLYHLFASSFGSSAWVMGALLFLLGVALSLTGLPLSWYAQFRLEQRFGFNTTTQKIWWLDRFKGLLLAALLAYPLLVLILKMVEWTGTLWWVWAWAAALGFQLVMIVVAPIWILPLFNKFTPLPGGTLRDRLLALGRRTGFHAQSIQVMDGSKRSRHSNAFFTGFGRFRRIVLFDTLIQHLAEIELEAVLAHEIGHYKRKHIPKMLAAGATSLFAGFCIVGWLARQSWFYDAFGFPAGSIVPALLLFGLLGGVFSFWLSPISNLWSRRYEYQADAYASATMGEPDSLIAALRKLTESNLSNLTPHPLYSGFYYSHPTLVERVAALTDKPPRASEGATAGRSQSSTQSP
jgi:STE24 endopeptidase